MFVSCSNKKLAQIERHCDLCMNECVCVCVRESNSPSKNKKE